MLKIETPRGPFINDPMKNWLRMARGMLGDKEYILYEEIFWSFLEGEYSLDVIRDRLSWHRHTFQDYRDLLVSKQWVAVKQTFGRQMIVTWVKRPGDERKIRTISACIHLQGPGGQKYRVDYTKLAQFEREHNLPRLFLTRLTRLYRNGETTSRIGRNKDWQVISVVD